MPPDSPVRARWPVIDAARGIVMVLMTLDHAGAFVDGAHFGRESAAFRVPTSEIPAAQFVLRWTSHVCAPAFLFLAGVSLALSIARRRRVGESERAIDGHILRRGALLIGLDLTVVSAVWSRLDPGIHVQVLWAIGASLILMIPLRRLPTGVLGLLAALFFVGSEWCARQVWDPAAPDRIRFVSALLFAPGRFPLPGDGAVWVTYPLVPWLPFLVLGHVVGRRAVKTGRLFEPAGWGMAAACLAIGAFAIRLGAGYGDMGLSRSGSSWLDAFYVSKYPPSLSYASASLSFLALVLAALTAARDRLGGPVVILGRSALLFYVVHQVIIAALVGLVGGEGRGGPAWTVLVTAVVLVLSYLVCRAYSARARSSGSSIAP